MAAPYLPSVRSFRRGEDFEVWMKSLEYYCLAIGAVEPERKKGLLLHLLGPEIQDIFETLPKLEPSEVETRDVFQVAVEQLKLHFKPKSSTVFEEVQVPDFKPGKR